MRVEQAKVERVKLETVKDQAANSASRISQVRRELKICVTALNDTLQELQVLTSPFDGASFGVMARGLSALKPWTEKNHTAVVYDRAFDEFSADGLFDKIKGKENVAVVAWMTQGGVFGGVYHNAMTEINENKIVQDMFIFAFESRGRCQTAQQSRLRNALNDKAFVRFSNCDTDGSFVMFLVYGCGGFNLGVMNQTRSVGTSQRDSRELKIQPCHVGTARLILKDARGLLPSN